MAVFKLFPLIDATIYSEYPTANTGVDPILEASIGEGQTSGVAEASRVLIKFSDSELNQISSSYLANSTSYKAYLRCFNATATRLADTKTLDVFAISGSWSNGTGRFGDVPTTQDGVSWINAQANQGWATSSFVAGTTASFASQPGGATWYTAYNNSQSFSYGTALDIQVDITDITQAWLGGIIPNDGLLIKHRNEFETGSQYQTKLKYFSVDTHTIYPPTLEMRWDDCVYNTGSLSTISEDNIYISLQDNPGIFKPDAVNRFRINVRPKFPTRVFQTSSLYTNNYYLPQESHYAVQDVATNEFIVDFDNTYTKISADSGSSYFDLYMQGFEPERWYKIIVRTQIASRTYLFDEGYSFKIVR